MVAVSVYVVVVAGETATVPFGTTVPTCEMLTAVAFCVVQERFEIWPAAIDAGFAVKVAITGSPPPVPFTVTVACAVVLIPLLVAVRM